jgi:hypothetical protein
VSGGRTGRAWAVVILARVLGDGCNAFVPNPAGVVQLPCRYAVQSALDALGIESLDRVLRHPGFGPSVREILVAHGGTV